MGPLPLPPLMPLLHPLHLSPPVTSTPCRLPSARWEAGGAAAAASLGPHAWLTDVRPHSQVPLHTALDCGVASRAGPRVASQGDGIAPQQRHSPFAVSQLSDPSSSPCRPSPPSMLACSAASRCGARPAGGVWVAHWRDAGRGDPIGDVLDALGCRERPSRALSAIWHAMPCRRPPPAPPAPLLRAGQGPTCHACPAHDRARRSGEFGQPVTPSGSILAGAPSHALATLAIVQDKGQVLSEVRNIIAEQLGTDLDKVRRAGGVALTGGLATSGAHALLIAIIAKMCHASTSRVHSHATRPAAA